MKRWFRRALVPATDSYDDGPWRPPADLSRTREGWLVKMDLAGVRAGDLSVSLNGRKLNVRGERRDWCAGEACDHYMMEIAYNRFERSIDLPEEMEEARLSSEYRDGMLIIRISKLERTS